MAAEDASATVIASSTTRLTSTTTTTRPARASTPPPTKKGTDVVAESTDKKLAAKKDKEKEEQEFGGPIGATAIMIVSHILMYAMAASLYGCDWRLYLPTKTSLLWFLWYHGSQLLFARIMPGVFVEGQTGLGYLCNAYSTLYMTLGCNAALHILGVFDVTTLVKEYPAFLTTAILLGDLYSVIVHQVYCDKAEQRTSPYAFFIGTALHPRIGTVDIKMLAETRLSWTLLLLFTFSGYLTCAQRVDNLLNPGLFMVLAHALYANACAKGEHFIPYTWDITTEKFGWMLCWWNLAGVPLLYCYQSLYIATHAQAGLWLPPVPQWLYYGILTVLLVTAYWIWDEANYHKCYFKMEMRGGELLNRNLWPTFRHVKNPKYLKCDAGVLLIDGWYKYARKIHYAADFTMAVLWGLSCGFSSPLPYFYGVFFISMITHRAIRDEARCSKKYGETWQKYIKEVPYRFIPFVW
eukprot:CAMPEP_0206487118 /NCGR_PEP_ID=MMETSP0324_2-20121206/41429_1 /ASSEMBLY_ACC=CAM_ASM_000836 /TAXON_ID=2866 /ORGANISM="Crypthecodinium cohnii, Strain Seligo" /LENGTH=464 /DNA_ID=CAMNT_0053965495 /DNA_START=39 /DNA_END=1430 /DNA_ORIENTATION=+